MAIYSLFIIILLLFWEVNYIFSIIFEYLCQNGKLQDRILLFYMVAKSRHF